MTQRRRKSRFLLRRPTNAYLSAVSADSLAARYSLLLLPKNPFVRARSFLRFARRTVPRLTRGMCLSLFVRKHPRELRGVLIGHLLAPAERALPLRRLARQQVALERRRAQELAGRALPEAPRGPPMCLQLRAG